MSRVIIHIAIIKATEEVVLMKEPVTNSIERFQSIDDRESLGKIKLSDFNYFMGIELQVWSSEEILPREVGSIFAEIQIRRTK